MRLTLLAVALVIGACWVSVSRTSSQAIGSVAVYPVYVTPFNPPPEYEAWYHDAEKCVGMTGNFKAVLWGVVPTPWGDPDGLTYAQWEPIRDDKGFLKKVEITVNAVLWRDSLLVMHESMHDILWRNGWDLPSYVGPTRFDTILARHPSPPYGKCAPIFYPWPKDSTK